MGTQVVIVAPGSRGHVDPCVGLGAALRRAGHRVAVAADGVFGDLVAAAGLELRSLPGDIRGLVRTSPHGRESGDRRYSRAGIAAARSLRNYMRDVNLAVPELAADADLLLAGELGGAAYHHGEAVGVPSMGVHVAPTHFAEHVDGSPDAAQVLRPAERLYFDGINELRAGHGLPPTDPLETYRRQHDRRWPVCFGFSPHVVPRPRQWREGLEITGYWWPHVPADWTPPTELVAFLEAGPPPVFVGFGSMAPGDAAQLSGIVAAGVRRAGQRAVVQAGWAGLTAQGDDLLEVADVPYEWLFPRTAAVVHAAGAGVTAAGLRAGVPAVPVPYTSPDQPFWARRLTALGVSPTASLRLRSLTAEQLGDAVRAAVTDADHRLRAASLATLIAGDDGAGRVLDTIADVLGCRRDGGDRGRP